MNPSELKYNNLSELTSLYKLQLSKYQPLVLVHKISWMYDSAEREYEAGKEEEAFILVMKMLSVISFIINSNDYKKHTQYYKTMVGNYYKDGVAFAEKLKKSLRERYDKKKQKESEMECAVVEVKTEDTDMRTKISMPGFITCAEFHSLSLDCETDGYTILIIDTRSKEEYNDDRLIFPKMDQLFICNIPKEFIRVGYSANKITSLLDGETAVNWQKRASMDFIVLIDDLTVESDENSRPPKPILILRSIMREWDPEVEYRHGVLILNGGFKEWTQMYPWYSLNGPNNSSPKVPDGFRDSNVIPNIEYPDLDFSHSLSTPEFDRSTKPIQTPPTVNRGTKENALKIYEDKKMALKQKENELNQSVTCEKQIVELEMRLKKTIENNEIENQSENENIKTDYLVRIQELKDESIQKDKKIKILEDRIAALQLYPDSSIGSQSDQKNEEVLNSRIKQLEAERCHLVEKRKKLENLTERRMLEERNWEKVTEEVEKRKKSSVAPVINRTTKPVNKTRDFCPVRGNVGPGLTGLKNLGNSCYMNSIIQCISNNVVLKELLEKKKYGYLNRNGIKGCIADEMSAIMENLWCGQYKYISCQDFKDVVGSFKSEYGTYEQHDSHEFFTFLMDWLHNEFLNVEYSTYKEDLLSFEVQNEADKMWQLFLGKNLSVISHCFYGQQKSTVRCLQCHSKSITYEPFSDLSLTIPENSSNANLMDCISQYMAPEIISGWKCEKCSDNKGAEKKTELCRLPRILVLHLKRFSFYDIHSQKKTALVHFPLENLCLESCNTKQIYSLYSVSNHIGTTERGHYTAYCKNPILKKWYKYDDHEVTQISEDNVATRAAYILFYTALNFEQILKDGF